MKSLQQLERRRRALLTQVSRWHDEGVQWEEVWPAKAAQLRTKAVLYRKDAQKLQRELDERQRLAKVTS